MYVIELGYFSGEGKHRQWESGGFYAGYTTKGPILVPAQEQAHHFNFREFAENVIGGDERLKASRIVEGGP